MGFRSPGAHSSVLAALGTIQPRAPWFLNPTDPSAHCLKESPEHLVLCAKHADAWPYVILCKAYSCPLRSLCHFGLVLYQPNRSYIYVFESLKHSQHHTMLDRSTVLCWILNLVSSPRARILHKNTQYSIIIEKPRGQLPYSTWSAIHVTQIAPKRSRLSVSNVCTVCKLSPRDVNCNHTLNRPHVEVYQIQNSGCFLEAPFWQWKCLIKNSPPKISPCTTRSKEQVRQADNNWWSQQ